MVFTFFTSLEGGDETAGVRRGLGTAHSADEKAALFNGTAKKAYRLTVICHG
jgi:hypothetical protein